MDHESDTGLVTRWADVFRLLRGPLCPFVAYALAPSLGRTNEGERVATDMDPAVLIAAAEAAGAGRSGVAVVSPVRPELLVVDLDGCAGQVLTPILDAAAATGAVLAYVAASGSPDSRHVAFAVTPTGRLTATTAVDGVRRAAGLSAKQVDVRSPRHYLRLPGSVSLKGAGVCWPVAVDGSPMTAVATTNRLRTALATVADAWSPLEVATHFSPDAPSESTVAAARGHEVSPPPPTDTNPELVDPLHLSALDVESPYAWKPRRPLTEEESALLNRSVEEGQRSDQALKACRVLIDAFNIRSWRTAKWYLDRYPVFAKFRERDQEARAKGRRHSAENPSLSYRLWSDAITTFREHRAPVATEDQAVIDAALAEVACWDDADLVAAAVAVIHYRYSDGHGIADRPISTRCLAAWLSVDHTTASRRIKGLVDRGLLTLVIPHNRYTARQEAHRYRLHRPSPLYRTDLRHELTDPRLLTHPLWSDLGQSARHVWDKLGSEPVSTAVLADLTGQSPGTSSHGVKRALDALQQVGLVVRVGTGRGTQWMRGQATLDAAAGQVGTTPRHRLLLATINTEREAWHTTNPRTRTNARDRLAYLHKRQHQASDPRGRQVSQLALFGVCAEQRGGRLRRAKSSNERQPFDSRGQFSVDG